MSKSKEAQGSIFGPRCLHPPMFDLIITYRPKLKKKLMIARKQILLSLFGRIYAMFFMLFAWGGEQGGREGVL